MCRGRRAGRLRELGLFSLEKRRLQGDLRAAFWHLKGAYEKDGDRLFSRACSNGTGGNGFKLTEGRLTLAITKKCFMLRLVKPWHRLPTEVVDAPSLGTFKVRLDGALSNLAWLKMSLLTAGGWTAWPLKVPSNPDHSVILGSYPRRLHRSASLPASMPPAAALPGPHRTSAGSQRNAVTQIPPGKLLRELIDHISTVIGTCKA